jgi:hypothetical protein
MPVSNRRMRAIWDLKNSGGRSAIAPGQRGTQAGRSSERQS